MKKYDVLAAGYYGFGNLGDELLASAVVEQLHEAGIDKKRIAILSASTGTTLGVDVFNRWKPADVFRAMRLSRTLLLGGGGLFQDATSAKSCVYYWGLVRMAQLHGLKVWTLGQSIGPLHGLLAAFLAKDAFRACSFRGVRDLRSLALLEKWGLAGCLSSDIVTSLKVKNDFQRGDVMLLNLRPGYDDLSARTAVGVCEYARKTGLLVKGVAFSNDDAVELKKYQDNGMLELVQITVAEKLSDYENILPGSCCAIGMRLHFVVLSVLAGLPSAAVPYDPKVDSFCEKWNVPIFVPHSVALSKPSDRDALTEAAGGVSGVFRRGLASVLGDMYGTGKA